MELRKIEFSIEPLQSAIAVRLSSLNIESIKRKITVFISKTFTAVQNAVVAVSDKLLRFFSLAFDSAQRLSLRKRVAHAFTKLREGKAKTPSKKARRIVLYATLAILVFFGLRKIIQVNEKTVQSDQRVEIAGAKASADLNREFKFPLRDNTGEQVSEIKFTVNSAELRDEIIVKGKRATAVKGRTFLILNLKVANDFDQTIEIDTRDYIRLTVNGNEDEKLAPDIHNDPVEVQAISTKLTRLGFPINDSDTNLKLLVGEISEDKETIELNL